LGGGIPWVAATAHEQHGDRNNEAPERTMSERDIDASYRDIALPSTKRYIDPTSSK
jgi:hypothetical protein